MKNQVQLCTYADRLGCGNLDLLNSILESKLENLFSAVHLLPFYYPFDGADAGFDPIDHSLVDKRLGTWEDVSKIGSNFDIMADLIVNHMSSSSEEFQDVLKRGKNSPYHDLFLSYDSVFPNGATETDLLDLYRPRPGLPFTRVRCGDGSERMMWTTFTSEQIDINVASNAGLDYLNKVMSALHSGGANILRLDAAGYAVKQAGTSCFMTDQTFAFIDDLTKKAESMGIEVLVEIHSHYKTQIAIAKRASYVYDFALPPLVLHALHKGQAEPLVCWLNQSPRNCVNVLDTHDGIGIIDVAPQGDEEGLLSATQIDDLVNSIHDASEGRSRQATGAAASNVDLYQVNCTFYEALGSDDDKYLLARLIQFFAPGVPQVYYAGLFAAENDMDLLNRTRVGRDINRPYMSLADIDSALEKPVVRHLCNLIRLRNLHPAFQSGEFDCAIQSQNQHVLKLSWKNIEAEIEAEVNCTDLSFKLSSKIHGNTLAINRWDDIVQVLEQNKRA